MPLDPNIEIDPMHSHPERRQHEDAPKASVETSSLPAEPQAAHHDQLPSAPRVPVLVERIMRDPLVTPREASLTAQVGRRTLANWAASGRISFVTLPSGHNRYFASEIKALSE